jgi:hypothetical protein
MKRKHDEAVSAYTTPPLVDALSSHLAMDTILVVASFLRLVKPADPASAGLCTAPVAALQMRDFFEHNEDQVPCVYSYAWHLLRMAPFGTFDQFRILHMAHVDIYDAFTSHVIRACPNLEHLYEVRLYLLDRNGKRVLNPYLDQLDRDCAPRVRWALHQFPNQPSLTPFTVPKDADTATATVLSIESCAYLARRVSDVGSIKFLSVQEATALLDLVGPNVYHVGAMTNEMALLVKDKCPHVKSVFVRTAIGRAESGLQQIVDWTGLEALYLEDISDEKERTPSHVLREQTTFRSVVEQNIETLRALDLRNAPYLYKELCLFPSLQLTSLYLTVPNNGDVPALADWIATQPLTLLWLTFHPSTIADHRGEAWKTMFRRMKKLEQMILDLEEMPTVQTQTIQDAIHLVAYALPSTVSEMVVRCRTNVVVDLDRVAFPVLFRA